MKTTECFKCDLSPRCRGCGYYLSQGYIHIKRLWSKRATEAWNYYHPDDLMPQKGFCIHHKNGNRLDDSKENIEKWTDKKHKQYHNSNRSEEFRENLSKRMKGKQIALGGKHTKEANDRKSRRMKGNQCAKGCKRSKEFKENLKGNQNAKGKRSKEAKRKMSKAAEGNPNKSEAMKRYWADIRSGKRIRKKEKGR